MIPGDRLQDPLGRSALSEFIHGWRTQRLVIGALLMRELHTRYGRDNIGYLWMIGEPFLLATAVAVLHGFHSDSHFGSDIHPVPFTIGGYVTFIIFRGIVGRAEAAIDANAPLLYHRIVTIFDIMVSRAILDSAGSIMTMIVLLAASHALGFGGIPARPVTLLVGIILLTWLSFGAGMLVCAATYGNHIVAKFVHPTVYILMPLSGCFFILEWIPEPYRGYVAWSPMTQMFQMIHAGQFESVKLTYVDPLYLIGWCMVLTYLGMIALKVVRRHVHLS